MKARTGGEKGRHLRPRLVQKKTAQGKTSYELSWKVKVSIKKTINSDRTYIYIYIYMHGLNNRLVREWSSTYGYDIVYSIVVLDIVTKGPV